MDFSTPLIKGTLIKRYKRFLADVELENGELITAHTPNTGSMRGCCEPGSPVWLRDSGNPDRKYPLSWELVEVNSSDHDKQNTLVGINTHLANHLVEEAITQNVISSLSDATSIRREVKYGKENSRIDLLLSSPDHADCYVEVKNVTLVEESVAYFPDAVSARGTKHLRELILMIESGYRAALVFCLQRDDANEMRPADQIDPLYGETLRKAQKAGVEILAYAAAPTTQRIILQRKIPVSV